MSATKIQHHTCAHADQDKLHGRGMRVWNRSNRGWRCTVCGSEVVSNEARPDTKGAKPKGK